MGSRVSQSLEFRLNNWGLWVRGGTPKLEARNGIWSDSVGRMAFVQDAELVEFTVTSWRQIAKLGKRRKNVERFAFVLKLHYVDQCPIEEKLKHYAGRFYTEISRRTYYRILARSERSLGILLARPAGDIAVAIRALEAVSRCS